MAILQERIEDLSVYYFLVNSFASTSFIKVVDGFPKQVLTVPTISVEWESLESIHYEIGSRDTLKQRIWYIDVFANNKSQRDDITYTIVELLENPIPVYNYNEGFTSPSRLGALIPMTVSAQNTVPLPELIEEEHYRATIKFVATYDRTGE